MVIKLYIYPLFSLFFRCVPILQGFTMGSIHTPLFQLHLVQGPERCQAKHDDNSCQGSGPWPQFAARDRQLNSLYQLNLPYAFSCNSISFRDLNPVRQKHKTPEPLFFCFVFVIIYVYCLFFFLFPFRNTMPFNFIIFFFIYQNIT